LLVYCIENLSIQRGKIFITHHDDGNTFFHFYDQPISKHKSKPLTNFTGITELFSADSIAHIKGETNWEDYLGNNKAKILRCKSFWERR